MKRIILSMLLVVGFIAAYPSGVQAGQHGDGGCSKCAEKAKACEISKLKQKVGLLWENQAELKITEKQMSDIKEVKHNAIKQLIQFNADKEIVMVDLESQMWKDTMDIDAVNPLIDAKYVAKTKSAKTVAKAIADIQQILNVEQRVGWKKLCKEEKEDEGKGCSKGAASQQKLCPITGKEMKDK